MAVTWWQRDDRWVQETPKAAASSHMVSLRHVSVIGGYGRRIVDQQAATLLLAQMTLTQQFLQQTVFQPQMQRTLRGMNPHP